MSKNAPASDVRISHYQSMIGARLLEERLALLYGQGRVPGGVYLGIGQEALSAAGARCLKKGDVFAPLIRDQAGRLAFGESYEDVLRAHLGKITGPQRGRDGNVHRGRLRDRLLPMVSHLGAMPSLVGGLLLADRHHGISDSIGLVCIGEGGLSTGATSEALNLLAVEKLPVVMLVANNGYAYSTPNEYSFAIDDLQDRGRGFGWNTAACDGRDSADCISTCQLACDAARAGNGPQMVIADLMRLRGHGEHDDGCYMSVERKDPEQDCLHRCEQDLLAQNICDQDALDAMRAETLAAIEAALTCVDAEADASVATEDWRSSSCLEKLYAMEVE